MRYISQRRKNGKADLARCRGIIIPFTPRLQNRCIACWVLVNNGVVKTVAIKENYVNYYEAVLPKLRPGGLLVADNVLWSGKVLDPREKTDQAIVAFNDRVARDARVEQVMLSVRDGILVVRKR